MVEHLARAVGPAAVAGLAFAVVLVGGFLTFSTHAQVTPVERAAGTVAGTEIDRMDIAPQPDERHIVYELRATYRYEVDGETCVSRRLAAPEPLVVETEGAARTLVGDLEGAESVPVYYDPANPGRAYLRANYPTWWLLGHTLEWATLLGLLAVDVYGLATRPQGMIEDVPLLGVRTPLGSVAALPLYAGVWVLALVPWTWYLDLAKPSGFGLLFPIAAAGIAVAWALLQAHSWVVDWTTSTA